MITTGTRLRRVCVGTKVGVILRLILLIRGGERGGGGQGGEDPILGGGAVTGLTGLAATTDVTNTFLPRNFFPCIFSIMDRQSVGPRSSMVILPDFLFSRRSSYLIDLGSP